MNVLPSRKFRFVSFSIAAVLFLFVSQQAAMALQFDVFVGFNGVLPEGNWAPMAFEIKNDGPSFTGVIEVNGGFGTQTRRFPLELPTGTLKRVIIPIFSTSRYGVNWNVRLLNERGKIVVEQPVGRENIKSIAANTPLLGALAKTLQGAPTLPTPKAHQAEQNPVATRMQPALFPDNPIALEGMTTLYLNSDTALDLKVEQVQALVSWINGGGHLIVGVEQASDVNATPWLKNLLPCEFSSSAVVKPGQSFHNWLREQSGSDNPALSKSHKGLLSSNGSVPVSPDSSFENADLPVIDATVREGEITVAADSHPLMIDANHGRGQITVLTFSPEREPFLSWKNKAWFWAKIANIPASYFETNDFNNYGGWSVDGIFGAMVDSKQVRKLPLAWLLLLLLTYLVVIGPFDRWWLKKINRQMLTWITFPAYVVFFSGLIYVIGFKLRAGDSEYNEIHIVDIYPNGEQAVLRGRTFASIYSPSNARYPVASSQPFATLRGEYMAQRFNGSGQENSQAEIIQHGNNFSADVFVPVWTSQLFVSDWLQSADNPLSVTTTTDSRKIHFTVANHLDHPIEQVVAIYNGSVYELGAVESGKPITKDVDPGDGRQLAEWVRNRGGSLHTAVQMRQNTFGDRPKIDNMPLSVMAACFSSQLIDSGNMYERFLAPEGFDLSSSADGHVILLAWDAAHSLIKPLNQFSPRRLHRDTLFRLVVPLNKNS